MNIRIKRILAACLIITSCVSFCGCKSSSSVDFVSDVNTVSLQTLTDGSSDSDSGADVKVENPIDFKDLQSKNSDLYAWIYIPNTSVDYPIAQSGKGEDDAFYLHHGVDKSYYFAGTIYSEKKNSKDFNDRNTLLYGHNMLDGSMFTTLHKFEDESFFENNQYIYIYTPGHILTYKICAAYEYDDRHILNSFDFSDDKVWADYVKWVNKPESPYTCNYRDTGLTTDDTIITLSTCTNYRSSDRYLVQAKLESDKPTL
ncbi:MAG: class B sortase [Clostridiales bacterium]|nr:class B sortase [Clostridiales bacterium]